MPSPWKAYGEVRGLKAPPRRIVAPGGLRHPRRLERSARLVSTAHGPAMNVNESGPIGTAEPVGPTQTVERWAWCWRLTSL